MKPLSIEESLIDEEKANLLTNERVPANSIPVSVESKYDLVALRELSVCFVGLLVSYVTWGIMQELIMSTKFNESPMVPDGLFPTATFCVFANRILAIFVALAACMYKHGTIQSIAPLYAFSPPALSNTLSSWAQYKSLNYVSFPLQNLFKSTKLIPVMIMGRLINGTTYSLVEVGEAVCISIGVLIFSTAKASHHNSVNGLNAHDSSITGMMLLCTYVICDSFTSQYQSSVFRKYGKIDQYHMMFGVNLSAIVFTTVALLYNGDCPIIIDFLLYNPVALMYIIITAVCSATGQMFIFYTIRNFGPVVFTIIMTTRQIVSMFISTIYFSHPLSSIAVLGTVIVFAAVFHSIRRQTQKQNQNQEGRETAEKEFVLKK